MAINPPSRSAVAASSRPATADTTTRRVQAQQLRDISANVGNHSLSLKETRVLLGEQRAIAQAQTLAMEDGKLTNAERLRLTQQQTRAGRNILQATRNADVFDPAAGGSRSGVISAAGATHQRATAAQYQSEQLAQIAQGRARGTITPDEAMELLGDQERLVAQRKSSGSLFGYVLTAEAQSKAQAKISYAGMRGSQRDDSFWQFL